jgi:8-amino-7-oxononanoate synthase
LYRADTACVFNSGYHANIGIISALADTHDLVLSDKLNHASIIDGLKLSGARFMRYRHCDYDHLALLLKKHYSQYRRIFLLTESVFSMDGDIADLSRLIELKQQYNAILIVDEAHAVGVFGKYGGGICETEKVIPEVDIIVGTFGKALASVGAFAVMRSVLKKFLVNKMRSLIFTTALPPIVLNWNRFVLRKVIGMEQERHHVQTLSARLRQDLEGQGLTTGGSSQIIPVVLGENKIAIKTAEKLQRQGFLVFAIRPPTVPPKTARLRLSLSAAMSWQQLRILPVIIGDVMHEITLDRAYA